MKKNLSQTIRRKKDHLKIALSEASQVGNPGFDRFRFIHNALPDVDFYKVDTSTIFLGRKIKSPFFISCMTGGVKEGERLNRNLARAAQKYRIPMGVGSQRIAIEHRNLRKLFMIRNIAPDVPIIANIGLVQLNYGYGLREFQEIVNMIGADALAVHLNPIQEVIQPEGDRNFENLLPTLERIIPKLKVPVIVKEVGFGLSEDVIRRLYNIGIRIFDTAGWGGTNWAIIEGSRGKVDKETQFLFSHWGISTTDSILAAKKVKDERKDKNMLILGSGGVRSGVDIAKSIALGANLAGIAMPFAQAALESEEKVGELIEKLSNQLKIAMFGIGAINIKKLMTTSSLVDL